MLAKLKPIEQIRLQCLRQNRSKTLLAKYYQARAFLVFDILPPVRQNRVAREVFGLKNYSSKFSQVLGVSWRLIAASFLIFFFVSGVSPFTVFMKTLHAVKGTSRVNIYSSNCQTDKIASTYQEGWYNQEQVFGRPGVLANENILAFSPDNSAFYNGGDYSLICTDFEKAETIDETIYEAESLNKNKIIEEVSNPTGMESPADLPNEFTVSSSPDAEPISGQAIVTSSSEEQTVEIIDEPQAADQAQIISTTEEQVETAVDNGLSWLGRLKKLGKVFSQISKNLFQYSETMKALAGINNNVDEPMENLGTFQSAKIKLSLAIVSDAVEANQINENIATTNIEMETEPATSADETGATSADEKFEDNSATEILSEIEPTGQVEIIDLSDQGDENILLDEQAEPKVEIIEETDVISDVVLPSEIESIESTPVEEIAPFIEATPIDPVSTETESASPEAPAKEEAPASLSDAVNSWFSVKKAQAANQPGDKMQAKLTIWYSFFDEPATNTENDLAISASAEDTASLTPEQLDEYLSQQEITAEALANQEGQISTSNQEFWQELATIYDNNITNATNGGYLSFDAPFLTSWDEVKRLKIKITGDVAGKAEFTTYLDSVWVEAEYEHADIEKPNEKKERWSKMLKLLSAKTSFKFNEKLEMQFRYDKNGQGLAEIFGMNQDITSYWQDVDVEVVLHDPSGQAPDMPLTIFFEDDGGFTVISENLPINFRPGKYQLVFTIDDRSGDLPEVIVIDQDFTWGVLAININKSIFAPAETAYLQMAVLDDNGDTVCDADLQLEIIAPDGGRAYLSTENGLIARSIECGANNVVYTPDYYAYYGLAGVGVYRAIFTATTPDGTREIYDQFEVRKNIPFDIERSGPTRIYPKADYWMNIIVRADENYEGNIIETVPTGFKIVSQNAKLITENGEEVTGYELQTIEQNNAQQLIWQNIKIKKGEEIKISYKFDAPDISPEFYLLGELEIGAFKEARFWQIASDAVKTRAKSVQFLAGVYSANGTTGQNSDTDQIFSVFNFQLAENNVSIKNAYIILEAQYRAYLNDAAYTYSMAFDSCAGAACTPIAFTGANRIVSSDTTTLAYDESESDIARILLDVTSEAQLAAYTGGSGIMRGQVGYRFNDGSAGNSIANVVAKLVVNYTYDANNSPDITNTIIYPLESVDSASLGTKATSTANNCALDSTCPLFNYNMDIGEYDSTKGSTRLSQWFETTEQNYNNLTNDIGVTVNIQGTDISSSRYLHESALSDQSNILSMYFTGVSGYAEKTSQVLEYQATTTAGTPTHYLVGGEVFETYTASSSAATSTRTVSFPLGVLDNGLSAINATSTASVDVYFPENGTTTGRVVVKKAWLRINTSQRNNSSGAVRMNTKVSTNATSTTGQYDYYGASTVINPSFTIYRILPATDYAELALANANTGKTVTLNVSDTIATAGGLSAELMITYAYIDETQGYLTNLNLFAGQSAVVPGKSVTTPAANLVMPETSGKTVRAAALRASYLVSSSDSTMITANILFDANLSTSTPTCANAYVGGGDGVSAYNEMIKNVTAAIDTTANGASLNVCYSTNGNNDAAVGAKMNGILNYTYSWVNTAPTSIISATSTRKDGMGIVDISIKANDVDGDELKVKIEYEAGTTCAFSSTTKLAIDTTDANTTATYDDPKIDNFSIYQIGTTTGWITTVSGENTVNFDWLSQSNLAGQDGYYCLRLITNDNIFDQATSATTTVLIDNKVPTAPGPLSENIAHYNNIILNLGATTTETRFTEYKIYYKINGGATVSESDELVSSSTNTILGQQFFPENSTTTISGLAEGETYQFNIWAYDNFGNKASGTPVTITTNKRPAGAFTTPFGQKNDGSGRIDIAMEIDDLDRVNTVRAKLEYTTADCNFGSGSNKPMIDSNPAYIQSDFGLPDIDNNYPYQVGTTSSYIYTAFGSNTVQVDWLSRTDLTDVEGTYCLRLTANDLRDDQAVLATTTVNIDNVNPTNPGALQDGGKTVDSITLQFGATSTDTNFSRYRIFYREGTSGVVELTDPEVSDVDLNDRNFNSTATTTVGGLNADTYYVFKIWAYDNLGNKASSSETVIKTNATITNDSLFFINPVSDNIAVGDGSTVWRFQAVVNETNGWAALANTTLSLADISDNSSPFNDLKFQWQRSGDVFSEVGSDIQSVANIAPSSSSSCAGNSCTLNFDLIFNYKFASSSLDYAAELFSENNYAVNDQDEYHDFYQVKIIRVEQLHYRWRNDDGGE